MMLSIIFALQKNSVIFIPKEEAQSKRDGNHGSTKIKKPGAVKFTAPG
jgi:hypothetical protein